MATTTTTKKRTNENLLRKIYDEVHQLRQELFWLTRPEEELEDYAHPERIKRSLKAALKEHPPRG